MPQPPDVTVLEVPAAFAALAAAGWENVTRVETRPPWAGAGLDTPRVARQRTLASGVIELVVVYPRYERPARDGRVRHRDRAG